MCVERANQCQEEKGEGLENAEDPSVLFLQMRVRMFQSGVDEAMRADCCSNNAEHEGHMRENPHLGRKR